MRDKRPVDELSIAELERILAIRKREERQQQLRRFSEEGRRIRPATSTTPTTQPTPITPAEPSTAAQPLPAAQAEPPQPANTNPIPHFEDDFEVPPAVGNIPNIQSAFRKQVWNRTLMLVEILAFVGIVAIGVMMVSALQDLQNETAAVQAEAQAQAYASIPTPTVTPEIRMEAYVLPGGHTPPTSGQAPQFNYNEIPEHLRPIIQQQLTTTIAIPTPGPESPVRVVIPAINVDAPVVTGTDWEALKRGIGYQPGTGNPGQRGNVVLSAHNDIYSEIFRYLDQLEPDDEIIIYTLTQQYTYVVRDSQIVTPSDVWVMDPTHNPTTTLISCYPYQVDNQRIVVFAQLQ